MRLLIIITTFLLSSVLSFAQTSDSTKMDSTSFTKMLTDMFSRKVDVPIDTKLFSQKAGTNMYFTEAEDAFVMMMVFPVPIDKAEGQMEKQQKKKEGYKRLETGSFKTADGRKIIFEYGALKAEGKKMLMDTYGIETKQGDVTIYMSAGYMAKEEKKYKQMVKSLAEAATLAE